MTHDPSAHVSVWIDAPSLARAGAGLAVGAVAEAALAWASGAGRVTLARAYGDWGTRADDLRALEAARVTAVQVTDGPAGEDRAHVRLAVEAMEARFAGGEPDAFVLVTADERLLPLLLALKADGADVLVLVPSAVAGAGLRAQADGAATLEEAAAGAKAAEVTPRFDDDDDPPAPAAFVRAPAARPAPRGRFDAPEGRGAPPRRGYGDDGGPGRGREADPAPLDFARYDWTRFVTLLDELEHRLPFVGVRYLVNKVMGPRNVGVDDPRLKRDLINRAVDDGVLEMYEVGNLEGRGDPVTACRLDRASPVVVAVLGEVTRTPTVPETRPPADDDGIAGDGGSPAPAGAGDDDGGAGATGDDVP